MTNTTNTNDMTPGQQLLDRIAAYLMREHTYLLKSRSVHQFGNAIHMRVANSIWVLPGEFTLTIDAQRKELAGWWSIRGIIIESKTADAEDLIGCDDALLSKRLKPFVAMASAAPDLTVPF